MTKKQIMTKSTIEEVVSQIEEAIDKTIQNNSYIIINKKSLQGSLNYQMYPISGETYLDGTELIIMGEDDNSVIVDISKVLMYNVTEEEDTGSVVFEFIFGVVEKLTISVFVGEM